VGFFCAFLLVYTPASCPKSKQVDNPTSTNAKRK
jgi:hypothetical protein